eukprot:1095188-Pelagomonas_calceolata.AAC.11
MPYCRTLVSPMTLSATRRPDIQCAVGDMGNALSRVPLLRLLQHDARAAPYFLLSSLYIFGVLKGFNCLNGSLTGGLSVKGIWMLPPTAMGPCPCRHGFPWQAEVLGTQDLVALLVLKQGGHYLCVECVHSATGMCMRVQTHLLAPVHSPWNMPNGDVSWLQATWLGHCMMYDGVGLCCGMGSKQANRF